VVVSWSVKVKEEEDLLRNAVYVLYFSLFAQFFRKEHTHKSDKMTREKPQKADCLNIGIALMRQLASRRLRLHMATDGEEHDGAKACPRLPHRHPYWEIKVHEAVGEGGAGGIADMVVVPPGVAHGITQDATFTAVVSAQRIGWYHGIYGQYVAPAMGHFETRQLFELLNVLRPYAERRQAEPPAELGGALSSALLLAMAEFWERASFVQQNYCPEAIARDYLAMHLADPEIRLESLALCVGCSERRLLYRFRKEYHVSPMQLLTRMRMQQARKMLSQGAGGATIQEVAIACGYRSRDYFSRIFTREVGCTPAAFRDGKGSPEAAPSHG